MEPFPYRLSCEPWTFYMASLAMFSHTLWLHGCCQAHWLWSSAQVNILVRAVTALFTPPWWDGGRRRTLKVRNRSLWSSFGSPVVLEDRENMTKCSKALSVRRLSGCHCFGMFSAAQALRVRPRATDLQRRPSESVCREVCSSQEQFIFLHPTLDIRTLLFTLIQLVLFMVSTGHLVQSVDTTGN